MHGGGFVGGNIDSEDLINRQICSVCNVLVFSIEYRLAPEYPVVPIILNDVEDGLQWTYANAYKYGGVKGGNIFVSGTSSGKY
jgi:acetyl esterase/lipase